MMDKVELARSMALAHRAMDPAISRIIRLLAQEGEQDDREPIKLLEVNPDTPPFGIVPIGMGANPPLVPFPLVLIEVTPLEFEDVSAGRLTLPDGWRLGDTLYPASA